MSGETGHEEGRVTFGEPFGTWQVDKSRVPAACGLSGLISQDGKAVGGEVIIESMKILHDRGNGLGGGFAGYGIYPGYPELFAIHIMFEDASGKSACEALLEENLEVHHGEVIPTLPVAGIEDPPLLWRYFAVPRRELELSEHEVDDFLVSLVMRINTTVLLQVSPVLV